jgi:hypothetical protein
MTENKDGIVDEGAMQTMSVAPPDENTPPKTPDQELDAELDQSMDASDPPSVTQPGVDAEETEAHPS